MKAVIQRVTQARVTTNETELGSINKGFLILLGVGSDDTQETARKLWDKIFKMRIFEDSTGKTNLSLADVNGEVLIVSQFTLYADCKKGNRPSFTNAMEPVQAEQLYEYFLDRARADIAHVAHGKFGAMMDISLVNSGPFTIVLDTNAL